MRRGFTTRARYDEAQHDVAGGARAARQRPRRGRQRAVGAARRRRRPTSPRSQAARVARDQALLNLARTEVRAPADGIVSQTDRLQVGAAVVTGVPVVTMVRSATT